MLRNQLYRSVVDLAYFNHACNIASSRWDRRRFVSQWRRIYAEDGRWVPPYYPALRRALDPARERHVARWAPVILHLQALPQRQASVRMSMGRDRATFTSVIMEEPVAAAVALLDPRRTDGAAYLALLHCANDPSSLRRLLSFLAEELHPLGCQRLIGPTGLSPHVGTGLLQDHWDELPPLHTPYDPPYMPEMVSSVMRPLGRSRLYHLDIPLEPRPVPRAPAQLSVLEPARLTIDLLPLLIPACPSWAGFLPPDAMEAHFLLRWLRPWPTFGWLAQVGAEPVGFVLLQPDLASLLRRADGGRRWWWRRWLAWACRRPARQGRLLAGAVLPQWRGQGVGRQLLQRALLTGYEQGWQRLSIGPLPTTSPGGTFLERRGARPGQTFLLYQWDL